MYTLYYLFVRIFFAASSWPCWIAL